MLPCFSNLCFLFFYLYNKTQSDVLASLKDDLQYISILQNFGHATSASHKFAMNGLQLSQILVPPLKFALETFFNNQELKVHKQDIREKAKSDHRVGQIRCQAVSFIQICGKLFQRLMIHTHTCILCNVNVIWLLIISTTWQFRFKHSLSCT